MTAAIAPPLNFELASIRAEARRLCDLHDLDSELATHIEAALRQQAFGRAIQPLVDIKVRIFSLAMPKMVYFPETKEVRVADDGLTDDARETIKSIDATIAEIAKRYRP